MTCNTIRIKLPQGGGKSTIAAKLTAGDPKAVWIVASHELADLHRKNNPTCSVIGMPCNVPVVQCSTIVIDAEVPDDYITAVEYFLNVNHPKSTLVVLESI